MVLDLQSFSFPDIFEEEEEAIPLPTISVEEVNDTYGRFVIEPLEPGFGITLCNPLRRVLYNSLSGTAITGVRIEGILHEYSTIPHVKEEVSEILLNIKNIRLRTEVDNPGKLRLEVSGEGEICAGDIMASSDYVVVNPELHLATLDSPDAELSLELTVGHGKGYLEARQDVGQPIGVMPVDAVFTPVRRVNYTVERTRVGRRTDFERVVFEVWTEGSTQPMEAMQQAATVLVNQFFLFANIERVVAEGAGSSSVALKMAPEQYNTKIEELDLSSRTLNCLKRAGIDTVGEVLERSKDELLEIRNFGEKSYSELFDRLRATDLLPGDLDPDLMSDEHLKGTDDVVDEGEIDTDPGHE